MSRLILSTAMLSLTLGAANARADKPLPIERSYASDRAQAAQIRGLSINPLSVLNPLAADHSARTPEVKAAMKTLVRYLAIKIRRGALSNTAVLLDDGKFAVTKNGKIYSASTSLYKGGPGTITYRRPVVAEQGMSAARVTAAIKDSASKVQQGRDLPMASAFTDPLSSHSWD